MNGCKTTVRTYKASYVWIIEKFDFVMAKKELLDLESSVLWSDSNDRIKWFLELEPVRTTDTVRIVFTLSPESDLEDKEEIFAKLKIFVFGDSETVLFSHDYEGVLEFDVGSGIVCVVPRDNYSTWNTKTLKIRSEVEFSCSDVKDVSNSSYSCDSEIEVPECNLSKNFASLFKNQILTDVVLSVNGKDYHAHKTVLAARSLVFRAMFTLSTKENELNRVDIEDLSEEVVGELLNYIYTGKCENLDKLAEGLLTAADKYDLYQLKMMCAKAVSEALSVENAANVLALADMHGVKELKNKVIKFIVSKPTEVFGTEGWKSIRSNFELVDEVCLALARR